MKIGKYDLSNPYDRKQFWDDVRAKAKPIAKGLGILALIGVLGYAAYKGCSGCAKKNVTTPKNPVPSSDTLAKVDTTKKNIDTLTLREWAKAKETYAEGRAYIDSVMEANRKKYPDYFDKKDDYPISPLKEVQVPPGFAIDD